MFHRGYILFGSVISLLVLLLHEYYVRFGHNNSEPPLMIMVYYVTFFLLVVNNFMTSHALRSLNFSLPSSPTFHRSYTFKRIKNLCDPTHDLLQSTLTCKRQMFTNKVDISPNRRVTFNKKGSKICFLCQDDKQEHSTSICSRNHPRF